MVREQKNNYAALSGEVIQEPIYSHSAGGEDYFTFPLRCLRLSGAEDLLNLVLSRTQLEQLDGRPGDRVGVVGQVRSYNNHSGQGSKLVITVRVQALFPAPAQEDSNQVRLVGNLCRRKNRLHFIPASKRPERCEANQNAPFYIERCVFGRSGFFVFPFRLQLGEAILSLLEQAGGVFLHELEGAFEAP